MVLYLELGFLFFLQFSLDQLFEFGKVALETCFDVFDTFVSISGFLSYVLMHFLGCIFHLFHQSQLNFISLNGSLFKTGLHF